MKRNSITLIGVLVFGLALVLAACGPGATPSPAEEPTAEPTEEAAVMEEGEATRVALVLDGSIDDQSTHKTIIRNRYGLF